MLSFSVGLHFALVGTLSAWEGEAMELGEEDILEDAVVDRSCV